MSKNLTIATNATTGKILKAGIEEKKIAVEALSYFVDGYEQTPSFKANRWDGRSSMYNWEEDTFPVGLIRMVNYSFKKNGYNVVNVSKPLPAPLGHLPKTLGGFSYSDRYDYQWEAISALEQRGQMIARFATGGGKTFCAALAIAKINRPTLILTKRQPLFHQFHERLKKFGFESGLIGDSIMDINSDLTIAMTQTLSARLAEKDIQEYLNTVEFIIGEEVHEVSDNSYWSIIQRCPNAYYKMGLTATPFMKEKSESNMKLLSSFGSVGIDVPEKLLIDRGINAKPIIKFASYERPDALRFGSNYAKAVNNGIITNIHRNKLIVEHAVKARDHKMPCLILVKRKEHGKILERYLNNLKIKSEFIFGETNNKKRKDALNNLSTGKTEVLIGSTIVDVGIDVPAIGLVIMAGGGKDEVAYRQRIGRGLREKTKGPNVCFILDFRDEHNMHLNNHFIERLKIIKGTNGFVENLLPEGEDFPWRLFEC